MSGTYGGLGRHIEYGRALARVTQDPVEDKMRVMERSGLYAITLRSFIQRWSEELNDYYGEDFGSEMGDGLTAIGACFPALLIIIAPITKTPIILPVITAESNSFESLGVTLAGLGVVEIGFV